MASLSMNETTTLRWSFEEDVAHYAAAGIPAIGVWRQKLSDYGLAKGRELLGRHGLRVSHVLWAGGFTGSDGRSYRESLEDARDALRTTATLGGSTLVAHSGARSGHTHNHARRLFLGALRELAPLADELGVIIAIEPMHAGCAADWTFLTCLGDAIAVLDAVSHPAVKLVFDTYHLGWEAGIVEQLGALAPRIALVQLGDSRHPPQGEQNRCRLGEGVLPLKDIVCGLRRAGYDGYFDVELLGEEIETVDYANLLQHARTAYQSLVLDGRSE